MQDSKQHATMIRYRFNSQ